ncbi:Uma2 family endonuclease [Pannus brasiliensis CCIBt3594]|uniref:Uma2 family endonuclease n=1 Tax=Pannus brasiliensis CCIBt3594 TaxID=1427578 RepID=A0AAW9QSV8_9CHRO
MVVASRFLSLEDFWDFDDGTDTRYELEEGELRAMPPENDLNLRIASFLIIYFSQVGIPAYRLRIGTEIVVSGTRPTVRVPDLMVLSEELASILASAGRSTVTMEMPPPELVVEVVSPGRENVNRDYRYKRSQYQARGIGEYWIVDPIEGKITILSLVEGLYEESVFTGDTEIVSAFLPSGVSLTAARVLQTGV